MRALVLLLALVTASSAPAQGTAGRCDVLPADNPWNLDVSGYPVHPLSATFIASIELGSTTKRLHPDFGTNPEYGIPYVFVPGDQPRVPIAYDAYGDESDPGPFPIPPDAPVEGGDAAQGDRHVIVVDTAACMLYELFAARKDASADGWTAESGAKFDLGTNDYRPDGWTSADAAGLPIFPGLVRYEEVATGSIDHAVRFTSRFTQRGWIHPARHHAGRADTTYPPMGLRLRMRADYDISGFTGQARVIMVALKKYGMILADNGSSWFISGTSDPRWDVEDLDQLKRVPGAAFEAVETGPIKRTPEVSSAPNGDGADLATTVRAVDGALHIQLGAAVGGPVAIELFDARGRRAHSSRHDATAARAITIELGRLGAGVFLCRVVSATGTHVERIVVRR